MTLLSVSSLFLLSGAVGQAVADPRVLAVPFSRAAQKAPLARRDPAAASLRNNFQNGLYTVQVSVGTPAQNVTLQVDTGSSDIWFFDPSACEESQCVNGTFDPTRSSTYSLVDEGTFNITYADQSGATGDYISDVIDLGSGLTVQNQTMALATAAQDNQYGLFGIAFRSNEASLNGDSSQGSPNYTTFTENLVGSGVIRSQSYSLWLDDLQASTGTILFGGYDPDQWTGPLTVLPLLPDYDAALINDDTSITSFTVELSMVALTNAQGETTVLNQQDYPIPVILDSGTTLTEVPPDTFIQLAEYFGAQQTRGGGWVVDCSVANWRGSLDYGFGGPGGAVIQVPFSELAIRQSNDTGSVCQFGLDVATDAVLIGDTFLRSAYVIYDLDAQQVAIGQSAWNSQTSDPREIAAGDDLASLVSGARADATATLPLAQYTSLAYQEAETTDRASFDGHPQTATITGVRTSLSVASVAAPTTGAQSGSRTSTAGGAIQTAAMMLPMALPFAAALL